MSFQFETRYYQGSEVSVPIPKYRYQKYDAEIKQIRLLSIKPARGSDTILECELLHFNFDDPPDYTALSYECGDPSDWTIIYVDRIPFPVSKNLYKALRRLRSVERILVWVDAISINQIDLNEKSTTIQNMNHIYHNATSASVYLGPESSGSDKVMTMLTLMEKSRQPAHLKTGQPWSPSAEQVKNLTDELGMFFQRGYWTRVWIIQEIALGSDVIVHCGSHTVNWKAIELFLDILASISHDLSQHLGPAQHLYQTRLSRVQSKPLSLLQAMFDSTSSLATIQLDKVYALLGISFDGAAFVAKPDYVATDEQLCLSMVQSVIRDRKNMDIIFVAFSGDHSALPSWCPNFLDWTQSQCLKDLIPYLSGQDLRYRNGQSTHRWSASCDSLVTRDSFTIRSGQMRTRGYLIGQIVSLGRSMCTANHLQSTKVKYTHKRSEYDKIYHNINRALTLYDPKGSSEDVPQLFYFLFRFEQVNNRDVAVRKRHKIVVQWREKNKDFMIKKKSLHSRSHGFKAGMESGQLAPEALKLAVAGAGTIASAALGHHPLNPYPWIVHLDLIGRLPTDIETALLNLASLISEDLRIMATDKDDVGWAHPSADLGDQISLLRGCSMPVILRPSTKTPGAFTVVGHAYVAGVMGGEVWSKLEEDDLQDVCIV